MLGQPEPLVAETVGGLGEGQRLVHRATEIAAFDDGRQVKNGEWDHDC